nr:uncharacterized protein c23c11.06c [Quercus suber]
MQRLRVAIAGGGIASLCLAHALNKQHPGWEIKIFEGSRELRDEGAAIGLGSNAQQALALISSEIRYALDEAGAVIMDPSVRIMIGTGKDSGRHVGDIKPVVTQMVVHRGSFWRALRRLVPDDVVQFGKKLASVEYRSEEAPVELLFEDGTSYQADAVVGCDGINSITRQAVLGADHPAVAPIYTNGYNHRVVISMETAKQALGEDYCSLQTQYGWIGDSGFLLTDHVDAGKSMQVIAGWSKGETWSYPAPYVEWPKDRLESDLAIWGDIGKAMTKPKLFAAGGRVHLDTSSYCKGAICIAGDAAQTFPPFQGAGAGQAIEDALMLTTVLGACSKSEDIRKAFRTYDALRRPRRAEIAKSSEWTAALFTGKAPGIGLDPDLIAAQLPTWGSNIYNYDLVTAQAEGLRHDSLRELMADWHSKPQPWEPPFFAHIHVSIYQRIDLSPPRILYIQRAVICHLSTKRVTFRHSLYLILMHHAHLSHIDSVHEILQEFKSYYRTVAPGTAYDLCAFLKALDSVNQHLASSTDWCQMNLNNVMQFMHSGFARDLRSRCFTTSKAVTVGLTLAVIVAGAVINAEIGNTKFGPDWGSIAALYQPSLLLLPTFLATMSSLWGAKKNTNSSAAQDDEHENGDMARHSEEHGRQPTERDRLLPDRRPPPAEGYLDPDDPAVSPYNLWTIRALRFFTVAFAALTFFWWVLLLVSIFVSPPGLHTRGSGFFDFSYTTLTLGLLLLSLLFFSAPSTAIRVCQGIIGVLLLVDLIVIVSVARVRAEEGPPGIASVTWATLMAAWCIMLDRVVAWGKREEEERLTGRPETRRTLKEWLAILVATVVLVVYIVIVVLMTATLILRCRDVTLEMDGERVFVDGGKYEVHIACVGDSKPDKNGNATVPTVLLEAGEDPLEYDLEHWAYSAYQNGTIDRYCYWDRPGYAWSDNAPSPHSAGMSSDNLGEALAVIGEDGPFVLVSAGYGSIVSRIFSARNYRRVVGIMMVDPLHEDLLHQIGSPTRGFLLWAWGILSPLGLQRVPGALFYGRTREDRVFGREAYQGGKYIKAQLQENLVADSLTKSEVASARTIQADDTPLVVVSSGIHVRADQEWERKQEDLTKITGKLLSWDVVKKAPHEVWQTLDGRQLMEKRLGQLVKDGKVLAQSRLLEQE